MNFTAECSIDLDTLRPYYETFLQETHHDGYRRGNAKEQGDKRLCNMPQPEAKV
jgi:hypothetical protein